MCRDRVPPCATNRGARCTSCDAGSCPAAMPPGRLPPGTSSSSRPLDEFLAEVFNGPAYQEIRTRTGGRTAVRILPPDAQLPDLAGHAETRPGHGVTESVSAPRACGIGCQRSTAAAAGAARSARTDGLRRLTIFSPDVPIAGWVEFSCSNHFTPGMEIEVHYSAADHYAGAIVAAALVRSFTPAQVAAAEPSSNRRHSALRPVDQSVGRRMRRLAAGHKLRRQGGCLWPARPARGRCTGPGTTRTDRIDSGIGRVPSRPTDTPRRHGRGDSLLRRAPTGGLGADGRPATVPVRFRR